MDLAYTSSLFVTKKHIDILTSSIDLLLLAIVANTLQSMQIKPSLFQRKLWCHNCESASFLQYHTNTNIHVFTMNVNTGRIIYIYTYIN